MRSLCLLVLSTVTPLDALVLRIAPSRRAAVVCSSSELGQGPGELGRGPGLGGRLPRRSADLEADSAATEYSRALAEAQRAAERLRDAERQLLVQRVDEPLSRPRSARATITRSDAGTLIVDVPAAGMNGGTVFGAAFSAAWFSAIIPATATMIGSGGASALFMLPFWAAGGLVAKDTVLDPAKATELSIGEFAWELRQTAARRVAGGLRLKSSSGATDELDAAEAAVAAYVNGVPTHVLRLGAADGRVLALGGGLPLAELEWLASEINAHLAQLRRVGELEEDGGGSLAPPPGAWPSVDEAEGS